MSRGRDLTPAERQRVERLVRRLRELEQQATAVRIERGRLFAELLKDGASPTRIGVVADLSGEAVRYAARRSDLTAIDRPAK